MSSKRPPRSSPPLLTSSLGGQGVLVRRPGSGEKPNPALLYFNAKSAGSRPAIRAVLCRLGGWLNDAPGPISWEEACVLPWWEIRARHVSVLRTKLIDAGAPRTTNRDLSILRSVLKVAWANEMMTTDAYMRTISEPGVPKDDSKAGRALEPDEVLRLLATRDPMGAAIVATMYGAGLRRIEISRLQVDDVDLKAGSMVVHGKGNKKRMAYWPTSLVPYVAAWLKARGSKPGPLFCHGTARVAYTAKGIADVVSHARAVSGVEAFTAHDLRRSFGTHLLAAGQDLSMVRKLMGHADIRTTTIYDRRDEVSKQKAVQALDPRKEKGPAEAGPFKP